MFVVYCSTTTHMHTHLIFLSGELVLQFELLCLQLVHPVPQLFGFLSVRNRRRGTQEGLIINVCSYRSVLLIL